MNFLLFAVLALLAVISSVSAAEYPASTGQHLSANGAADSNWVVSSATYTKAKTFAVTYNTCWPQFSKYANWISPTSTITTQDAGNYTFSLSWSINDFDPKGYSLTANVAVDDHLVGLTLNGAAMPLQTPCTNFACGDFCMAKYKLADKFVAGTNTLSFTINNIVSSGTNPVGLWVEFNI